MHEGGKIDNLVRIISRARYMLGMSSGLLLTWVF